MIMVLTILLDHFKRVVSGCGCNGKGGQEFFRIQKIEGRVWGVSYWKWKGWWE